MSYYKSAITRTHTCPHIHLLFLSLMAVFTESNQMPNISSVSESDLRAERENYYMSPNVLPPLDIHFDGKNGMAQTVTLMILCLHWQLLAENVWHPNYKNIWWRLGMKQWVHHRQLPVWKPWHHSCRLIVFVFSHPVSDDGKGSDGKGNPVKGNTVTEFESY